MSYERLHRRARELIASGTLPRGAPDNIFAGYGSDRTCQLCGAAINGREIEYELEFSTESPPVKTLLWFHLGCHAIWDYERTRTR
jgi:hypothetical protein